MGLLEPDVIVPAQWLDLQGPLTSERRLAAAVVIDAIQCFRIGSARAQADAEAWFTSTQRDWPFSFENICDALNVDSDCVRDALRRWREESDSLLRTAAAAAAPTDSSTAPVAASDGGH